MDTKIVFLGKGYTVTGMETTEGADDRRRNKQLLERTREGLASLETNRKDGLDVATWTI